MKIGLIRPFYTYVEHSNYRYFAFGIAYIANYAIKKGHQAEILDLSSTYLKKEEIISRLKDMKCDVIGISAYSDEFDYVKKLISLIKSILDLPVVVGGTLATFSYEIVLKHTEADMCAIGQGEETTCDILENIKDFKKVKGIAYKDSFGKIVRNVDRPLTPLDDIPLPAYQLFDMDNYIWNQAARDMDSRRRYTKGFRVMQVVTGRGCPMGCSFCSKIMGRRVLLRSIDKVIEEIRFLMERYGINGVSFCDELYLINKKRAYELASKLKPLKIIWSGQARVDKVDYDLLKYMRECGCISLGFGIESGSPKILHSMNKGQSLEQIESAMRACQKLDMDMKVQLIMGYPGEDMDTIEETVSLFKRIGHPGRRFNLITPLPGSQLYDDLVKKGIIKDEFQYLQELSKRESGFARGLPLINLTQFSDEELSRIKLAAEKKIEQNYQKYLWTHPGEIFRYFCDRLIYKRYLFTPFLMLRRLCEKLKLLSIDKEIEREKEKEKLRKSKSLEYKL